MYLFITALEKNLIINSSLFLTIFFFTHMNMAGNRGSGGWGSGPDLAKLSASWVT